MVSSIYHDQECALQAHYGMRDRIEAMSQRLMWREITPAQQAFFSRQSALVLGTMDLRGRPWATVVAGDPGFIATCDGHTLNIGAVPAAGDPVRASLNSTTLVGGLGIDFDTRERHRFSGRVSAIDCALPTLAVGIDLSYHNCPKYIQPQSAPLTDAVLAWGPPVELSTFDHRARELVANASTAFIASASPDATPDLARGVDVSHRGGARGFMIINGERSLQVPDYLGNHMFNTLGNLRSYPWAGLLILDASSGDALQISGTARVELGLQRGPLSYHTDRSIRFDAERILLRSRRRST
jgi:predicted pyridoxine 5'-phosphate oxidase superfamily flavin-nucleotide-binding protein